MIFPKGQVMYENMNTSFTNFSELFLNLNASSFTGYVQVSFLDYEGVLLVDSGKVVNAFEEVEGKSRVTGQKAVVGITRQAKERDGTISVYYLSAEMVTILASVVKGEAVYKDLTTELTSLDKLLDKLKGEEHTGYIEVEIKGGKGSGITFLQAGEPIECIFSANGEAVSGPDVLPRIIELSANEGAAFNVYRAAAKEVFAESAEIMAGFELTQLLEVWQEILGAVQRAADGVLSNGNFRDTLKDVLVERATDYPFLDPFAGEFEYKDGTVAFHGEVVKDFSEALGTCLNAAIKTLATANPEANLAAKVKSEMQAVKKKHAELIERFGLEAIVSAYLS
jgi:hypothetical protein